MQNMDPRRLELTILRAIAAASSDDWVPCSVGDLRNRMRDIESNAANASINSISEAVIALASDGRLHLGKREDGGKRLPFDYQRQMDQGYLGNFFGRGNFELKLTHDGRKELSQSQADDAQNVTEARKSSTREKATPVKAIIHKNVLSGSEDDIYLQRVATVYIRGIEYRVYAPGRAVGDALDWTLHFSVVTPSGINSETQAPRDIRILAVQAVEAELEKIASEPKDTRESSQPTRRGDADFHDRSRRVWVVHGRDERLRKGVFTFLRSIGLEPLEFSAARQLTKKPSPYVGEILDAAFAHAQAVVVLLTPDDQVQLRPDLLSPADPDYERGVSSQARPNVIFEGGMAWGSHRERTLFVQIGDVKPFSDVSGLHILRLDNKIDKRQDFAQRLKDAGCPVNISGFDWHTAGDLEPPNTARKASPLQALEKEQTTARAQPTGSVESRLHVSPKCSKILEYKGKCVTVHNVHQGRGARSESVWPQNTKVEDCNDLWVTLRSEGSGEPVTFSLTDVELGFDHEKQRLKLEIKR